MSPVLTRATRSTIGFATGANPKAECEQSAVSRSEECRDALSIERHVYQRLCHTMLLQTTPYIIYAKGAKRNRDESRQVKRMKAESAKVERQVR
jgi:hypothetical protein